MLKQVAFLVILLFSGFILPLQIKAQSCICKQDSTNTQTNTTTNPTNTYPKPKKGEILISEFVSNTSEGEEEWVELYNPTTQIFTVDNLYITEGSKSKTSISGNISPQQYLLISKLSGNLNNSGDIISLVSEEMLIDSVVYGNWEQQTSLLTAPDTGQSAVRKLEDKDTDSDSDFVITQQPTPGKPNIISLVTAPTETTPEAEQDVTNTEETIVQPEESIEPLSDEDRILISEILPNPEGSDDSEWVEVYNPLDREIVLDNWIIDDAEGGSNPYRITNTTIAGHEYFLFTREMTSLALNNDTDSVRIFNAKNTLVGEVVYSDVVEGMTYALSQDTYSWTLTPTPETENVITRVPDEISTDTESTNIVLTPLHEVRTHAKGEVIRVRGIVTTLPGQINEQIIYIGDEDVGIQIYSNAKSWPVLRIGDWIVVIGKLSSAYFEDRINIATLDDIEIYDNTEMLPPKQLSSKLEKSLEGMFVATKGTLVSKNSTSLIVDNSFEEVTVSLTESDDTLKEGDIVYVQGIVQQRSSVFKIHTREKTDVVIESIEVPTTDNTTTTQNVSNITLAPKKYTWILIATAIVVGGILLYPFVKKKLVKIPE